MANKLSPRVTADRPSYYMGLAFLMAAKSKDPHTQMGAVIVSPENIPLGFGYNGPPKNIDDEVIDWNRPYKYDYIEHAEENSIEHSTGCLKGATIYVTAKPCKKCMLKIVRKQIKKVCYFCHKPNDSGSMFAVDQETFDKADEIAELGGVILEPFTGNLNWIKDVVNQMEKKGIFDT